MNETLHQLKKDFLQEWPLARIQNLSLDEYTNLDKNSFCYWLEAKTYELGSIWGGSSYKFGIYKRKDINTVIPESHRLTDGNYAWLQKYGETKDDAFEKIKEIILSIIENAQNNTLENIDQIDLGDAFKWKIAFLYGNYNIVNIFKNEFLLTAAQLLDYKEKRSNYFLLNQYILSKKDSNTDFFDFTSALWVKTTLVSDKRYWIYAPGEKAHKWDEFYNEGIMGFGWDELGDLDNYATKNDIKNKLQELERVESTKQNDTIANYEFHKIIKEGDIIIVKKGISELLGYGIVSSDYYFDETRESYKSCRKVVWKLKGKWKVDFNLPLKTLTDITKYPTEDKNYSKYYERLLSIMKGNETSLRMNPLNQILYGPPGTGKTYHTINKALTIIENKSEALLKTEKREDLKERFENYIKNGQIVFTTFHQSMSYEDFIEGIKPKTNNAGNVTYEIMNGIFKTISYKAEANYKQAGNTSNNFENEFELLKNEWIQSDSNELEIKMKGKSFWITQITDRNINFRKASGGTGHDLVIKTLQSLYNNEREMDSGLAIYYYPLIEKLKTYTEKKTITNEIKRYVLIIDEINRGNVSQIFGELITLIEEDKRIGKTETLEVTLPYSKESFGVPPNLYIIGTMNTADRSVEALDTALRRRFTFAEHKPNYELLEPNYQYWQLLWDYKDEDWNNLEYQKLEEKFLNYTGASDNIWKNRKEIWNKFEKDGKNPDQINAFDNNEFSGIRLDLLLKTINTRIEKLLDRDHQIGHAFFMNVFSEEELVFAFDNKIIPLLQEYFYGDYGKIGLVLGNSFIETTAKSVEFADFQGIDSEISREISNKPTYIFKDKSEWDFRSIYEPVTK